MTETLIATMEGYSIAKILLTISVIVLLGTFITMFLVYLVEIFMSTKRKKSLVRIENTLGLIFLIALAYIGVAIILSRVFGMPL